jgi:hypothetical protein
LSDEEIRAKVFISCGQRKRTEEFETAQKIEAKLIELGFDPYIATEKQTLSGVKESIFPELESSEYFLFIDFKREHLGNEKLCRGSLFSHQELALASYLGKQVIAFQEEGVKQRDGLMGYLQGNAIGFADRAQLPNLVVAEVRNRWNPHWKDRLLLMREAGQHVDIMKGRPNQTGIVELVPTRYFHITVKNLNPRKMATNCYAYLEKVEQLTDTGRIDIRLKTIEFKWEGYLLPNAVIAANHERSFDAFFVYEDNPSQVQFSVLSDSGEVIPRLPTAEDFLLTYGVISENFAHATQTFQLHLSNNVDDIRFQQVRRP